MIETTMRMIAMRVIGRGIGMTTETDMTTEIMTIEIGMMIDLLAGQRAVTGAVTTMTVSEDTTATGEMTIGVTRVTGTVRCTMTAGVATVSRATEMIVVTGEVTEIVTEVVTEVVTGILKRLLINCPSLSFSLTVNLK